MSVEMGCGQHVRSVDCNALRSMDCRGIAMIEMRVVIRVDDHPPRLLAIHPDLQQAVADSLNGAEGAVFDLQASLVAEEVQPIARGKLPWPCFGLDDFTRAELAGGLAQGAGLLIELSHVITRVGQH